MSDFIEISKAKDWPGLGEGYNIRFEGMPFPTTVYRQSSETMEQLIERTRLKFDAKETLKDVKTNN